MSRPGIFFLGGASGAGKTTAAHALAERFLVPVVELDEFQRLIMPAIPVLEPRIVAMRAIARTVLNELVDANASCLVDGSWLEPADAHTLRLSTRGKFFPVFCGYSADSLPARWAAICGAGRHWLTRESEERARAFLARQATNSMMTQQNCRDLAIPYVDFSSFDRGRQLLEEQFVQWLHCP